MSIIKINEDKFNIEIDEWNDFTIGLFKLYSDWRCNGQSKKLEINEEVNVKNNVKSDAELIEDLDSLIIENGLKEKAEKDIKNFCVTNKIKTTLSLFSESDRIKTKINLYNPIYRPVLEFILESLPNPPSSFKKSDIRHLISDFYSSKNRKISDGTAQVYSCEYRKHMIKEGIIRQINLYDLVKIKKKLEA